MYPICLDIGPVTIHWYGVMMALAFLSGLVNWTFLGRKEGRSFNFCSDLLFWIMVSGIVGARLAYVVSDFRSFLAEPLTVVRIDQGGLIFYGGFIGAGLAIVVFAKSRGEELRALLDFVATSVPLAHVFGRVGCLMNGCCYGREYHGPAAVTYPEHSLAWWQQVYSGAINRFMARTLPVHPVQLYEAAFNLILYVALVLVYRRRRRSGTTTAFYLVAYPAGRFLLEFLRGDGRMRWVGFSVAQWISMTLFAVGIWLLLNGRASTRRNEEP